MSGLPYHISDMEGGFETITPSRPGPYASSSQHQLSHFNLQPPLKKSRTEIFGNHRDTLDQDLWMDSSGNYWIFNAHLLKIKEDSSDRRIP
ncbi:hypothetical protein PSTG_14444 [Puccinia striiformis f. sp. tritici PST-78]|uniref:Uncharacterized protein n=1 Tax=Puccinia striiformis f. sp. tritici PST-78 TaxID=1165861 RepID=A0A0L0UYL8_9BASI|nr:hypothetical protein PSTG_14444 [Puccinia striiformis f. sp. tritici PST-78]